MRRIQQITGRRFDDDERLTARAYALIHDVTHIPFGHTLEDELNFFQRHDCNESRIDRIVFDAKSELYQVLQLTDYGRAALEYMRPATGEQTYSWIEELVTSATGADVLDYIDRDLIHCGLEHRVDTAIFRWFTVDANPSSPPGKTYLMTKMGGRGGLRLDAEFARLSVLRERYALFLKVYNHPAKLVAGAMLGKAVFGAMSGRRSAIEERAIEWMGDYELLVKLENGPGPWSMLAKMIRHRQLYQPVFRASALEIGQLDVASYEHKLHQWNRAGFFNPGQKDLIEKELAKQAGVDPYHLIIYCPPTAPGAQRVSQYVETETGREYRGEGHGPHFEMFKSHLALWRPYVFVHPDTSENQRQVISEGASDKFGLTNQLHYDRRQFRFSI